MKQKKRIYRNIHASIMRFCNDFIEEMDPHDITLKFVNFDAHEEITEFPDGDLVGFGDFALQIDAEFSTVICSFGITTQNDPNNVRHAIAMDYLLEKLMPLEKIMVRNAETGEEIGWMVVSGDVSVLAPTKTDTRAVQFVVVTMQTSQFGAA